jgi:lincosamide nucleotidyltransferase A/C/D/E
MSANQVAALQRRLSDRGLDWCVVGGWGVDALLGEQTREHKDLDVLLPLVALHGTLELLQDEGFRLAHTWSESRPLAGSAPLLNEPIPSAFVLTDAEAREVDVHVYDVVDERIVNLWDTDRVLAPDDLDAAGAIGGIEVRCMTAAMQVVCHQGYDLPLAHAQDVRRLQQRIRQDKR